MSDIRNTVKSIHDHSAVEEWELFVQENPEEAKFIKDNAKEFGYRRVIHVRADGSKAEAYIPPHKSREEMERERNLRKAKRDKFYNRPSVEDYVNNARNKGDGRSDTAIVEEYVDTYYQM